MAKLIYLMNTSLDGYVEDEHGSFDWAAPDEELFTYITELVTSFGTYLNGRRMYETTGVRLTAEGLAGAN